MIDQGMSCCFSQTIVEAEASKASDQLTQHILEMSRELVWRVCRDPLPKYIFLLLICIY